MMKIQYDGSRYNGWQRLGNTDNTIQGKIEAVLSKLFETEIEIVGSGRTDAGVHALAQVANFKAKTKIDDREIEKYLNRFLPQDISITEIRSVNERYHARYNVAGKTYLYKIWNAPHPQPFMRKYSLHIEQPLDVNEMKKAADHFLGEHDFTSFSNAKSQKKSNVRTVDSIEWDMVDGMIHIRVTGEGFLYNMVRKMVGTMIEVGLGRVKADDVADFLAAKERSLVRHMAEARGLYLEKVEQKKGY